MNIWFRIGAGQGGPQSPANHSPSDTKARLLRPFALLALTKEGSIGEGGTNAMRSQPPGRFSGNLQPLAPPASFQTALLTRKSPKIERFFAKWAPTSNRFWPKNRCYRKQSTKPFLTGARTHISETSKS